MPDESGTTEAQATPTPGGEGSGATPTNTSTPPARVEMTREEFDRQIQEARRTGERGALNAEELKALKAKAKRLDEIEESSKTELQKAVDRAAKAEAERDTALSQHRDALVRLAFTGAAMAEGLKGQQLADALALADLGSLQVDADGKVTGAEAAVRDVLKDRPYLVSASTPTNGTQNGDRPKAPNINATGHGQTPTFEQQVQAAQEQMKARGIFRI